MPARNSTAALLVLVALVALAPIAGVAGAAGAMQDDGGDSSQDDAATANASTGAQLATVIQVTDEEVRHEVEVSAFEAELDAENETARAAAIARTSAELQDRSATIAADFEAATEAREAGELSRAEYGQRLAVLHARADAVQNGFDRVEVAASETSSAELEAAGYNASANADARERLRTVSGSGSAALLAQFTGQADGEFSVETENGLEIEVESEDGEYSREFEREEPEHGIFEVSRSEARATAEAALSTRNGNASWTLTAVETEDDGYYQFEFAHAGAASTGEAEVGVDARENAVFSLEEELEPRESDDADAEGSLSIEVADGEVEPGATVTLRVTDENDQPVAGADVELDDGAGGSTDANGTVTVTVPDEGLDVAVDHGDLEGELEIELSESDDADDGEDDESDGTSMEAETEGTLTIDVATEPIVPGEPTTLVVTADGEAVSNATVAIDETVVGTTNADGELEVTLPDDDDVTVSATADDQSGTLEYEFEDD